MSLKGKKKKNSNKGILYVSNLPSNSEKLSKLPLKITMLL